MAEEPGKPQEKDDQVVNRLAEETGITKAQARDLVAIFGYHWPSLIREARSLVRKR